MAIKKHSVFDDRKELADVLEAYRHLQMKVYVLQDGTRKNGRKQDLLLKVHKDHLNDDLHIFLHHFKMYIHSLTGRY